MYVLYEWGACAVVVILIGAAVFLGCALLLLINEACDRLALILSRLVRRVADVSGTQCAASSLNLYSSMARVPRHRLVRRDACAGPPHRFRHDRHAQALELAPPLPDGAEGWLKLPLLRAAMKAG